MIKQCQKEMARKLIKELFEVMETAQEEYVDEIVRRLQELSPDPYLSDYIFFPEGEEMSPEEIIEKAFSYKSIQL